MERPTILVLGTRRTDNMPSLTRMLEILRPVPTFIDVTGIDTMPSGMHVEAPHGTIRVTTCPVMKADGCAVTGEEFCPDDQSIIDNCYRC